MSSSTDYRLYERSGSYIPRIAAVHDLCGYGNCSLGIAIPVLSAAGCDVCPLPTSLFSAHTLFPSFYMHDTTQMLPDYLDAWVEEGIQLDAIYSGFLGAPEQVDSILRLYREHPSALRIVDPVMGDAGKIYPTYTPDLCDAMVGLVDGADLLTPNLTEASVITGMDYLGQDVDEDYVRRCMDILLEKGAKAVVLKGIVREGENRIRNYIAGQDIQGIREYSGELLPYQFHGTGDLYCSCLLAAIMCGRGLEEAVAFASDFVVEAMGITLSQPDYQLRGVSFEPLLGKVAALLA